MGFYLHEQILRVLARGEGRKAKPLIIGSWERSQLLAFNGLF